MSTDINKRGVVTRQSFIIPMILVLIAVIALLKSAKPGEVAIMGIPVFTIGEGGIPLLQPVLDFGDDFLALLWIQVRAIAKFAALALLPGLAGAFYRKAFWQWFLWSMGLLFFVNTAVWVGFDYSLYNTDVEALHNPVQLYLLFEAAILSGFFAFRLRFYSADNKGGQTKKIVICIDGTWNYPGQTDRGFVANTNVFKLWRALEGAEKSGNAVHYNANRAKENKGPNGPSQIGLYYNGVGNALENTSLGIVFGGAFGFGAEGIMRRAYDDLVMRYKNGDEIYIFGFSRGAAIARMLAGHIHRHGISRRIANRHERVSEKMRVAFKGASRLDRRRFDCGHLARVAGEKTISVELS